MKLKQLGKHTMTQRLADLRHILSFEQFIALGVNDFALIISDIIVFKQLFTNIEIARFHFALR